MDREKSMMELQQQLQLSEELNARLQNQLQVLLGQSIEERTHFQILAENSDSLIPLLRCYDAALKEKDEEIFCLKNKLSALSNSLNQGNGVPSKERSPKQDAESSTSSSNWSEFSNAGNMNHPSTMLPHQESQELQEKIKQLSDDYEHRYCSIVDDFSLKLEEKNDEIVSLKSKNTELYSNFQASQQKIEGLLRNEHFRLKGESKKDLQLVIQEKKFEEQNREVESLRNQLSSVLHQTSQNHSTHLKVLEEKHKMAMQELLEQIKTHELTIMKFRAKFSQAELEDFSFRNNSCFDPLDLMDGKIRQTQETEIKRLYAELTNIQKSRDETVFRLEQQLSQQRSEYGLKVADFERKMDDLISREKEVRELAERRYHQQSELQSDLNISKAREENAIAQASRAEKKQYMLMDRLREMESEVSELNDTLTGLKHEYHESMVAEKEVSSSLSSRCEMLRSELNNSKERLSDLNSEYERYKEKFQKERQDLLGQLENHKNQFRQKANEVEMFQIHSQRLQKGLDSYKIQLNSHEDHVHKLLQVEEQLKKVIRERTFQVEQLKMEMTRMARDHSRIQKTELMSIY